MFKRFISAVLLVLFSFGFIYGCKGEEAPESSNTITDDSGEFAKINDVVITNDEF